MTTEGAINELQRMKMDKSHTGSEYNAITTAIQAIKTLDTYREPYNKGWNDGAKATYEHLKMCEEEQEPKTGEWQQDLDGTYLCSECGSGFKEQPTLMGKPMFLWCPLCGARMIEPQESEVSDADSN